MDTLDGDAAVEVLVERIGDLPFDVLLHELHGAVELIASFHPEVRSPAVAEAIAAALV